MCGCRTQTRVNQNHRPLRPVFDCRLRLELPGSMLQGPSSRERLSQAMVRSAKRLGWPTKPFTRQSGLWHLACGQGRRPPEEDLGHIFRVLRVPGPTCRQVRPDARLHIPSECCRHAQAVHLASLWLETADFDAGRSLPASPRRLSARALEGRDVDRIHPPSFHSLTVISRPAKSRAGRSHSAVPDQLRVVPHHLASARRKASASPDWLRAIGIDGKSRSLVPRNGRCV